MPKFYMCLHLFRESGTQCPLCVIAPDWAAHACLSAVTTKAQTSYANLGVHLTEIELTLRNRKKQLLFYRCCDRDRLFFAAYTNG